MKDNKKKKDRRKYPQGSAASHAGQNSGNHGGHAGHPRSRSSKPVSYTHLTLPTT